MAGEISYPPPDLSQYATNQSFLDQFHANSGDTTGDVTAMFASVFRMKDARSSLVTGATGVWTKTYPVGFWRNEPSVNVNPGASSGGAGQLGWRTIKAQVSGAWTVTVTFTMIPLTLNISLGTLNIGANPGVVTFDYQAFEPFV